MSSALTPEEEALELFGDKAVASAIWLLPAQQRKLMELIYLEGKSCRAAGREMGIDKSAADRRHRTALARLRPYFESSRFPSPKSESSP